jgi:hypothetical protein
VGTGTNSAFGGLRFPAPARDPFAEHAAQILQAAELAVARGESPSEMTLLITWDGSIRMIADSDWTLDSLALHHGARSAFRISRQGEHLRVDGRQDGRTLALQSTPSAAAARTLLGPAGFSNI